jgi:hypothetical protein
MKKRNEQNKEMRLLCVKCKRTSSNNHSMSGSYTRIPPLVNVDTNESAAGVGPLDVGMIVDFLPSLPDATPTVPVPAANADESKS